MTDSMQKERDAAIARAEKAEARLQRMDAVARQIVACSHGNGGVHGLGNSDVEVAVTAMTHKLEAVEAREWALGVQVVAQAERLKLAEAVVAAARAYCARATMIPVILAALVAAWDAVPGDGAPVDLG